MTDNSSDIAAAVRTRYGRIAEAGGRASCCSTPDPISRDLYSADETAGLPSGATQTSLGCGNPTALIALQPGQVVLDLGSGGGIDVLLSARRVGPTGKVYGLDMTGEMVALARRNQREAGADNVEFLQGAIESIPLPDCSIDVVISNCVINLSADKDATFREAFRVLKPGGQFAVSDVVTRGALTDDVRRDMRRWTECVAGALDESDYAARLIRAGFTNVTIEPWRTYSSDDIGVPGTFAGAFIRATRPTPQRCCAADCCAA